MYLLDFSFLGLCLMFCVTPSAADNTTLVATTLAQATTVSPDSVLLPASARTGLCTPSAPYNESLPNTFPLSNGGGTATEDPDPAVGRQHPGAASLVNGVRGSNHAARLSTSLLEVREHIVRKHNCLRSSVSPAASNMRQMEWNAEVAALTQTWADACQLNKTTPVRINSSQTDCSTIFKTTSRGMNWHKTIDLWFNQVHFYLYPGTVRGRDAGLYTQLVWAETYQVGCAWTYCLEFDHYVCSYCPGGNNRAGPPYIETSGASYPAAKPWSLSCRLVVIMMFLARLDQLGT